MEVREDSRGYAERVARVLLCHRANAPPPRSASRGGAPLLVGCMGGNRRRRRQDRRGPRQRRWRQDRRRVVVDVREWGLGQKYFASSDAIRCEQAPSFPSNLQRRGVRDLLGSSRPGELACASRTGHWPGNVASRDSIGSVVFTLEDNPWLVRSMACK